MPSLGRLTLQLAALVIGVAATAAVAEELDVTVTYVTGSSVYLSAGSDAGLAIGQRLVLMRGDEVVATVVVADLSSRRAACDIVRALLDPRVGDRVRLGPPAEPAPEPADESAAVVAEARAPRRRAEGRIRGRVGLRYLFVADRGEQSGDYSQPAIDLRLDGRQVSGSAWGFSVDARARRTSRTASDGTDSDRNRTRVYRFAAFRGRPDEPWNFAVGRQFSPSIAAVSVFDGVSAEFRKPVWSVGVFSGSQPEPGDYGFSRDIVEHGFYLERRGRPRTARRWSVTTGIIGSYEQSEINREFAYVQGRVIARRFSAYLNQEVDYNRSWKADAGESSVEGTSTYLSLRYKVANSVTIRGGYDNRRNVRLYRDRETPETVFDDTFRRGLWAGTAVTFKEHFTAGVDLRTNRRRGQGNADSYTVTFGGRGLTRARLGFRTRSSRYANDWQEGWLHSLDLMVDAGRRTRLRLIAGLRDEENRLRVPPKNRLGWYGVDVDFDIGRRWYVTLSGERTDGDLEQVDQVYTTLTYRF